MNRHSYLSSCSLWWRGSLKVKPDWFLLLKLLYAQISEIVDSYCVCIVFDIGLTLLLAQTLVSISCSYSSYNMLRHCLIDVDPSTKAWIVTAVGKLTSRIGQMHAATRDMLEKHMGGVDVELRQVGIWFTGSFLVRYSVALCVLCDSLAQVLFSFSLFMVFKTLVTLTIRNWILRRPGILNFS